MDTLGRLGLASGTLDFLILFPVWVPFSSGLASPAAGLFAVWREERLRHPGFTTRAQRQEVVFAADSSRKCCRKILRLARFDSCTITGQPLWDIRTHQDWAICSPLWLGGWKMLGSQEHRCHRDPASPFYGWSWDTQTACTMRKGRCAEGCSLHKVLLGNPTRTEWKNSPCN